MNKRNIWLVQLALLYFLVGGVLGLLILWIPAWLPGQPARVHGHLMTIGFTSMMIFGIALHVLPRFSGRPLYSETMADGQFYAVNAGLWLICLGWSIPSGDWLVGVGGILELIGFSLFGLNLGLTMSGYRPLPQETLTGRLDRRDPP